MGAAGKTTDLLKAAGAQAHGHLPSGPLKRKVVLLPVTPGTRLRRWEQPEASVRGRGIDTTQPRSHAGLGTEYPARQPWHFSL